MDNKPLLTTPEAAVEEIQRRRENPKLMQQVADFLHGDIPPHFIGAQPIAYLARHVATPSFETLHFIEIGKQLGLPIVIGEDIKDKFVSNNCLKYALGKLSVVKGMTRNSDEIIERFTIVNFDEAQGKPLSEVKTIFGEPLISIHANLLKEIYPEGVHIVDESTWIDRHHRGDLFEHYKRVLALTLVHSIMFETYVAEDYEFVETVLKPAFAHIESTFGYKPLISELIPPEIQRQRNWDAYPSVVYPFLKKRFDEKEKTNVP